jgi:hypothetical protein
MISSKRVSQYFLYFSIFGIISFISLFGIFIYSIWNVNIDNGGMGLIAIVIPIGAALLLSVMCSYLQVDSYRIDPKTKTGLFIISGILAAVSAIVGIICIWASLSLIFS